MSSRINHRLEQFSWKATKYSGTSWAFPAALAVIVVWVLTGAHVRFLQYVATEELENLHKHYQRLAELARNDKDTHRSLSVDSAEKRHHAIKSGDKPAA